MFITKKSLPRRTFLRGVGATVALPLLDAMVPALTAQSRTAATTAAPVRRRVRAERRDHGAMDPVGARDRIRVHPDPEAAGAVPGPAGGREQSHERQSGSGRGRSRDQRRRLPHGRVPEADRSGRLSAGVSIDQIVAGRIGQETPFPSLELATADFTGYIGACTSGFSCGYINTISWSSPTTPLPMEFNPRAVFERMFGRPGTPEQRHARRLRNLSILDVIARQTSDMQRGLGARDRTRLDEYLDNVREIERRIQRTAAHNSTEITSRRAADRHP